MTIQNMDAFIDALWDWGFLDGCFGGTRIRVSDLDGMVERNGWCLIIEAKGLGKQIPRGQQIMFRVLAGKGFTILVLWGEPNQPKHMQIWYPHQHDPKPCTSSSIREVQDVVRRWFNWASANGSVNAA